MWWGLLSFSLLFVFCFVLFFFFFSVISWIGCGWFFSCVHPVCYFSFFASLGGVCGLFWCAVVGLGPGGWRLRGSSAGWLSRLPGSSGAVGVPSPPPDDVIRLDNRPTARERGDL